MKLDGKELAKRNLAQKAENDKLLEEPHAVQKEILDRGDHITQMMSLIEAIHSKDPEAAHKHMMSYAQSSSKKEEE